MGISSLIKPLFSPSKLIWIRSVSPIRGLTNHLIVPNDHWQPLDLRDSNLNRKATNHARIYRISGSMDPFINFGTQIARYDFSFWVSAGDIERERDESAKKLLEFPFSIFLSRDCLLLYNYNSIFVNSRRFFGPWDWAARKLNASQIFWWEREKRRKEKQSEN